MTSPTSQTAQRSYSTLFVLGNFLGVLPIMDHAGVYKAHMYTTWATDIVQNPLPHNLSNILFWIGAIAGVVLGSHIAKHVSWVGGILLGVGCMCNVLGTSMPILLSTFDSVPSGYEIALAIAVMMDGVFSLLLGCSMVLVGLAYRKTKPVLAFSGMAIGICTIPVVAQIHYAWASQLLGIIGPAWLMWWMVWGWSSLSSSVSTPENI